MIDDKIQEQQEAQQPASPPPLTTKEKLRAFWARIQCSSLLRRHHFRARTRHRMEGFSAILRHIPLARQTGEFLYSLGFTGEYTMIQAWRTTRAAALWLANRLPRGPHRPAGAVRPHLPVLPGHPQHLGLRQHCPAGKRLLGRHRRRHRLSGPGHRPLRPAGAQNGALAVLLAVVQLMVGSPYTLAVDVNGVTVGHVANEDVFDSAREDVLQRVNYAGTSSDTQLTIEPTYRLAISSDVLDESQMADAILSAVSDEITEGTALYLDGELTAVCAEGDQLQMYLDGMLDAYKDPNDPDAVVSFNRTVTLEDGLYFTDSFMDYADVVALLSGVRQAQQVYTVQQGDSVSLIATKNNLTTAELCELNGITPDTAIYPGDELIVTREEAMLEVHITKNVTWTEEIPFTTEKTQSSDYAYGTTHTVQEGENGVRTITAQNVYDTEGNLLSQTITSSEVTKEPVTREIVVGTKIWPVPKYTYCSRWYSSTHKGVDICAPAGTPIYASSSGVVSKAGYERSGAGTGYGYSIIINHGNGYSTVYAHCLSLTVSAGQSVSQGQLIGYVGSTGQSSGNHCHFEIRYNGRYLPPQNYFKK